MSDQRVTVVRRAFDAASNVRGATVAAAVLLFAALLLRGTTDTFLYDAANYWFGGQALLTGGDFYTIGRLDLRGFLTIIVYQPAILTTQIVGSGAAGAAVLVQNSLLVAVLSTVVVPRLVGRLVLLRALHVWVSAILGGVLLVGFVPFPLMDLWSVVFVLVAVLLLSSSKRWWVLVLAGVALGAAVNIRPAYLAPVAVASVVWLLFHWRHALWPVIGVIAALAPQSLTNLIASSSLLPVPITTFFLANLQSQYASYVVRYDTLAYVPTTDPRLAYCDPAMAQGQLLDAAPTSTGELARVYLGQLPDSLLFMVEKVSAAFHWSFATPYAAQHSAGFHPLTALVIAVTAIGFFALVRAFVRAPRDPERSVAPVLLAILLVSVGTLAFSQPETRFALPVLMIGLVGVLVLLPQRGWRPAVSRATIGWVLGALALATLLLVGGLLGVAYPAPVGDYSLAICAQS